MFGKTHTKEARKIMSDASRNRVTNSESYKKANETKIKNRKVYEFYHKNGEVFIGTKEDLVLNYSYTKLGGIKELIAGKTYDKTCISGYSIVHSRYGWIRAELVGINADIEKLKNGK